MFTLCAVCIFLGLSVYYFISWEDNSNEPPGPKPWPIIGNLFHLATVSDNTTLSLGILAEKYGEIYSLRIGFRKMVILTSKEAMETIFINEAALARDTSGPSGDRVFNKNLGIAASHGNMWEKTKTWTFKTLKHFGFGKSLDMQRFTKIESQSWFADIDNKIDTQGGVIPIERYFNSSILAIMWKIIVGRITPEDETNMEAISDKGHALMQTGFYGIAVVMAYPFFRRIFPETLDYNVQTDYFTTCNGISKHLFLETESQLKSSKMTSHSSSSLLETFVQNYFAVKTFN
ncbi:cytochrome P450 2C13, male-specific-like isoform X2 [Folsomia candida]|uniref:cytochrome P450 2C13, male-specific-like isoform X2 n=1 Tax=Folsomia candida TaxID=158441 RepID=UPI0016050B5D|nr:cytochrome P450 2C13, male-specific-like isoform X2 [Folsomia candida]